VKCEVERIKQLSRVEKEQETAAYTRMEKVTSELQNMFIKISKSLL